jgi:hypothetical protein
MEVEFAMQCAGTAQGRCSITTIGSYHIAHDSVASPCTQLCLSPASTSFRVAASAADGLHSACIVLEYLHQMTRFGF